MEYKTSLPNPRFLPLLTTHYLLPWNLFLTMQEDTLTCSHAIVEQMSWAMKKRYVSNKPHARARTRNCTSSILKMGGCYDALPENTMWNEPRSGFALYALSISGMERSCERGRILGEGSVSSTSAQYRTSWSQNCHAFRLGTTWNGCDQEHTRLVLPAVELPLKMNRSQQGLVHCRGYRRLI